MIANIIQKIFDIIANSSPDSSHSSSSNDYDIIYEPDELGPINYFANDRHNVPDKWFQFNFVKEDNEWHAYIMRMPSFNSRDDNVHITHRIPKDNEFYVCFDPLPDNLPEIIAITKAWADRELEYISTGIPFEEQNW